MPSPDGIKCARCTMTFDVRDRPASARSELLRCPECGLPFYCKLPRTGRRGLTTYITAAVYETRTGQLWLDGR